MTDPENPFAGPAKRSNAGSRTSLFAWGVAVITTMAALLFLMLWSQGKAEQGRKTEILQKAIDEMTTNLANATAQNQTNVDFIAALKAQVADLQQQKDTATQMSRALENEMHADLESKDITIANLQGKLTMTILDNVMFDSGEAVLKPDGAAVMQKIGTFLRTHPNLKVHVVGHTDNVPIRQKYASNWELSTARALAAVHYLTEKAGVDPRRVGAVGYGEFRPIADNSTAEGRAKNRRIAITILPDESAAAETAAKPKPVIAPPPVTPPVAPPPVTSPPVDVPPPTTPSEVPPNE